VAVATAVLPDGRPIAVTGGEDATVRIWDLATGTPMFVGHTGGVAAVATGVLPDGRPIAVTGGKDATVRVWDLATGTPMADLFIGRTHRVRAVATAVLPDGRPIAITGGEDATVRIWDLQRMTAVGEPLHLVGTATALATLQSPTGVYLAATGAGIATIEIRHQAL
jgi:WD40 repeat protein